MKKKLALLLASVMTLSALPMNLFALSTNSVSGLATFVSEKTIMFERGVLGSVSTPAGGTDISYAVDGSDLVITLNDEVKYGDSFRVELENAKWFFKNNDASAIPPAGTFNSYYINGLTGFTATAATTTPAGAITADPTLQATIETKLGVTFGTQVPTGVKTNADGTSKPLTALVQANPNAIPPVAGDADPTATLQSAKDLMGLRYIVRSADGVTFVGAPVFARATAVAAGVTASLTNTDYLQLNTSAPYAFTLTDAKTASSAAFTPRTYDIRKGIFDVGAAGGNTGIYFRYPVNAVVTANNTALQTGGVQREVPYQMEIGQGWGENSGTVTILPLQDANGNVLQSRYPVSYANGDQKFAIRIPIVALTASGAKEVKVKVLDSSNASVISPSTFLFGSSTTTKTVTTVYDPKSFRDEISLERVLIKEERLNSIATGGVLELKAPSGWSFNDPKDLLLGVESGLAWTNRVGNAGATGTATQAIAGAVTGNYFAAYKTGTTAGSNTMWINGNLISIPSSATGDVDRSTIYVYVPKDSITKSTTINGALFITGLKMYPDANAAFGPAYMSIRTFGNVDTGNFYSVLPSLTAKYPSLPVNQYDFNITTQTDILAGTRTDWTLGFTAITSPIPTLVSGRYVSDAAYAAEDLAHKASKVQFIENSVSAWWAARETKFSLPAGVKFRRINIGTADKLTGTIGADIKKDYKADGTRNNYVTVDSDSVTLYNMGVNANEKAKIEFDSWISIQSGFAGTEVKMTVSNTTVPTSTNTVSNSGELSAVIAKVVNPVTIDVKQLTEVKVGYQTFATADVTITETAPGMLQKGKKLLVSVSDMITQDLYFAPINPATDVVMGKDSDLTLKNITTLNTDMSGVTGNFGASINGSSMLIGGGTIAMEIDRASTKASSITLKNLQVKVNRSVPQSTINYKIIAWGTAVAENYGPNKDEFTVPGIMKDYITIVSSATDKTSVLTQEVRLTIGEKFVLVSGKPVDMDAAAYLSTKSNSTMVPVRFVAQAFGITDDQIIYDDTTKTVTIIHPSRIVQFTNDSNKMMLNGAPVTMQNGATTEITKDRMYIPFRAIGDAFGISVDWDAATQTAVYNPATPVAAPAAAKK